LRHAEGDCRGLPNQEEDAEKAEDRAAGLYLVKVHPDMVVELTKPYHASAERTLGLPRLQSSGHVDAVIAAGEPVAGGEPSGRPWNRRSRGFVGEERYAIQGPCHLGQSYGRRVGCHTAIQSDLQADDVGAGLDGGVH
jgi:hypothetical protein